MHLSLLVECFVPPNVIHVHNNDKPWFNGDCRREFDLKQGAHLRWTRDLMNAKYPHKWWSTLKFAVFFSSSDLSLPPLIGRVMVWSVSRSGRQKCCWPILMESSPVTL